MLVRFSHRSWFARRGRLAPARRDLRLACLLSVLAVCASAAAQAPPSRLALPEGVELALPAGFREVPAPVLPSGTPGTLERVFTDAAALPLVITVQTAPPPPIESLPAEPGAQTAELVRGFAAGLPGAYDVALGLYAPEQSAISWEFKVPGASLASRLLAEPDSSPFWAREALVPGANLPLARCLFTQLLSGALSVTEAQLRANYPVAASRCALPLERVELFARTTSAAQFAMAVSAFSGVAFLTPSSTVVVLGSAPIERQADVRAAAAFILHHSQLESEARLPVATSGSGSAAGVGRLVGVVFGSFIGAIALTWAGSWLLAKSGMRGQHAVALCGGLVVALGLVGVMRAGTSLESLVRLATSLVASGVAYQLLGSWLQARTKPAASRSAGR